MSTKLRRKKSLRLKHNPGVKSRRNPLPALAAALVTWGPWLVGGIAALWGANKISSTAAQVSSDIKTTTQNVQDTVSSFIPPMLGGIAGYYGATYLKQPKSISYVAGLAGAGAAFMLFRKKTPEDTGEMTDAERKAKEDAREAEYQEQWRFYNPFSWGRDWVDWTGEQTPVSGTEDFGYLGYADDSYSGGSPYDTFPWTYPCIWEGAKDENSTDAVSQLILWLEELGYSTGLSKEQLKKVGPWFGTNQTFTASITDAVKRFQRDKALKVDGVVGPAVWSALAPWATAVGKGNCPKCAGGYKYGEAVPTSCSPAAKPTNQEILQRIADAADPKAAAELYGLKLEDLTLPPPSSLKQAKSGIPTWALVAGGVGIVGVVTLAAVTMTKKKKRKQAS